MMRAVGLMALLAIAAVLPAVSAEVPDDAWHVLIDATNDQMGQLPVDEPAPDARVNLETVAVRDLGDHVGIQVTTAATASDPKVYDNVRTVVGFSYMGLGGPLDITITATDGSFAVTQAAWGHTPAKPVPQGPYGFDVTTGSTAWSYELHLWRGVGQPDGQYLRGDEVGYMSASTAGQIAGQGYATWQGFQQNPWGTRVMMGASGGYALRDAPSLSKSPWYPYDVRAEPSGLAMVADAAGPHIVFVMWDNSSYYNREGSKAGVYEADLVAGHWAESFVGPVDAGGLRSQRGIRVQPAIAVADGTVHVLYDAQPSAAVHSAGSVVHAWRAPGGAWQTEGLDGAGLGDVLGMDRSELGLVATADRIVATVATSTPPGIAVVQQKDGAWSTLVHLDGAVAAQLALDSSGKIVVASLATDPDNAAFARVTLRAEKEGWAPTIVPTVLSQPYLAWQDPDMRHPFAFALRPDGKACVMLEAASGHDSPGAVLQCGDEPAEHLAFLGSGELGTIRLDVTDDGRILVAGGPGTLNWFGERATDGTWWWERINGSEGAALAHTSDGRALLLTMNNGGYGGMQVTAQSPSSHADVSRAFFIGKADTSTAALAPYRGETKTPSGNAVAPAVGQAPANPASTPTNGQSAGTHASPEAGVALLAALGFLAAVARRRGQRGTA